MRTVVLPFLALCIIAQTNPAAAQQRELGAHEHGRGTLNIAMEGTRVSMELEVPGVDIVGFEHAAETRKQKTAVDQAKKRLSTPQTLFKLPASAGCVVKEASAAVEGGEHDQDQAKDPAKADKEGAGKGTTEKEGKEHSEFQAKYTFECKTPANITAIEFDYFRAFPGAQKLDVNLITPKGQTKFEVTRAKPRIELAGMM
jgi:hypothetical protein